jgi:lysophospholipase L1-like esterase
VTTPHFPAIDPTTGLFADLVQNAQDNRVSAGISKAKNRLTYGSRFGFEGDSISAMSWFNWSRSTNYVASLSLLSQGKFKICADVAVAGTTTTNILARIQSDIAILQASNVQTVVFMGGTNDAGQSIPLATTKSNYRAIVSALMNAGFQVIICTIPPTDNTTPANRQTFTLYINEWIRQFANTNSLLLVDFFTLLLNPTTGGYKTGLGNGDSGGNVHPSHAGSLLMAQTFLTTVSPLLPSLNVRVPGSTNDPLNLFSNSLWGSWSTPITSGTPTISKAATGSTLAAATYYYKVGIVNQFGETLPSTEVSIVAAAGDSVTLVIPPATAWKHIRIYRSTITNTEVLLDDVTVSGSTAINYVDNGSKTPGTATPYGANHTSAPTTISNNSSTTPVTLTQVTDASQPGFMMRVQTNYGTNAIVQTTSVGVGAINAGDILAISIPIRGGGSQFTLKILLRDSSNNVLQTLGVGAFPAAAIGTNLGLYYVEIAAPLNFNNLYVAMQADDNVGWVDFGAPGVINLTQNATLEPTEL